MSIEVGKSLVYKWQSRFGLAGWRIQVRAIDMEQPDAWARSHYDIEEMWGVIELPGDEFFPLGTLELLVLHELAHGLLALASAEGVLEEQACNRIARLARSDSATPLMNEQRESIIGDAYYSTEGEDRKSATLDGPRGGRAIDKRKWLAVVADALPEGERDVISALYYEGLSMRATAERLGVDVHTVFRRKASALEKLHKYYVGLDANVAWKNARKLVELKMPEGGAEHEVVWETHHRCGPANALKYEMGEECDALAFGVGVVGYNMPLNTVFAVTALGPCLACGVQPTCQFVWRRGSVRHSGTIWTP